MGRIYAAAARQSTRSYRLVSREVRNNGRRFGNSDFGQHRCELGNTLVDLTPVGCHLRMLFRRKLHHTLAKPSKSG
jgi:hypothetical protein